MRIGAWSDKRRAETSAIHRKRWGAPEGMATVRGVHVPFEYRDPIAFFANRIAQKHGPLPAHEYVENIKARDWVDVPELTQKFMLAGIVQENRKTIMAIECEAHRANRNSR